MALVIDLCAGTGDATRIFAESGFDVITVDVDRAMNPTVCADVRSFRHHGPQPFFVWASPPCVEFSRASQPWLPYVDPDMSVFLACWDFIRTAKPKWWCIENVRGARSFFAPYVGEPRAIVGAFYLWGNFPPFGTIPQTWPNKEDVLSGNGLTRAQMRGRIPEPITRAIFNGITNQKDLFDAQSA